MLVLLRNFIIILLAIYVSPLRGSAQELEEALGAAIRLKQAHVIRYYESCMETINSESTCRKQLEELHPREQAALAQIQESIGEMDIDELNASMSSCYSPSNDYLDLIVCWEGLALSIGEPLLNDNNDDLSASQTIDVSMLEAHIKGQLSCETAPEPIFTLLALEEMGMIDVSEKVSFDSISCFRIHGGLEIAGLNMQSVCAYSDDPLVRELHPSFLWRGQGTPPMLNIVFGTNANFATVSNWYLRNFGTEFLNRAIRSERTVFGDTSSVECSSWMR